MGQPHTEVPGREPTKPAARVFAPWAIVIASVFGVATFVLFAFLQVLPGFFTLAVAVVIGLYGAAAALGPTDSAAVEARGGISAATIRWLDGLTWAATGVLAAVFLYAGLVQLFGVGFVVARYHLWQYPAALRLLVGAVELFAAITLLIPRIAAIGAVTLVPIMLGAIYTHLFRGLPTFAAVPMLLLMLLVFVGWERSAARRRMLEHLAEERG